jgi:hypothetical protein
VIGPDGSATVDVGDLLADHAEVTVQVGQSVYVGANDCGRYRTPAAKELLPNLIEVPVRERRPDGGKLSLSLLYRAATPGVKVISLECTGQCRFDPVTITITVAGA